MCVCVLCACVVCIQGDVTFLCTVLTTVIGDQIVTVVNGQDMDYKWLVDGQSIPKLSVNTLTKLIHGTADSARGPMWSYFHYSEYIIHCRTENQINQTDTDS